MKKLYTIITSIRLILVFLAVTSLFSLNVSAQTTLAPGDISFLGFNANAPDGIMFVTWVDLGPNTEIRFTDNGFNGTAASTATGNYREQEQYVVWTNNTGSIIPAGTKIIITINAASTTTVTNIGTITSVTNSSNGTTAVGMSLTNTSGDQVFAFQGVGGSSTNSSTATFTGTIIAGLGYSGSTGTATSWMTTGAINASTSYLPGNLSGNSQIFLGPNVVAAQYSGDTSNQTSLAAYKALVANPANWTKTNVGILTFKIGTSTSFTAGSPPPSITGQPSNSSICAGVNTTFSITASNAVSYQWQVNTGSGFVNLSNGAPYSGVTSATLTITSATSALNTYQYQCVVTGSSAPNATSNAVTLTVKANPTATSTPASSTICSGSATNIALTSTPTGASFAWTAATASGTVNGTSASSGTSIAQTLTGNGTTNYTVTPTLNSCAGSPITVAVTVNPNPTAAATPASATICSGSATNIALTSTPTGASFAWTAATASGTVNGTSASSGTSIAQTLSGNGTTNYTVTPTLNSCAGSPITVAVTVNPNPTATSTPASATICSGSATNIALTSTPTGASFAWTAATASGTVTGTSASSGTSIAQTLSGNGTTNYTVTPTLNSCAGSPITVAVTVNPNPTATATPASATICSGSATNIALTSTPTGASFVWTAATASGTVTGTSASSGTSIAQTLSGNGTTNYTVTPTLNSCAGSPITVAVTVNPNPTAAATPASATICSGSATNIALTSTPTGASFAWTAATASGTVNGTSASSGTSIAQTLSGNGTTNYTVTPTLNSCTGSPITVAVTVNPNPTATATPVSATICSGSATNIALTSTPTGASFVWTAATASGTVTGTSASSGTSIAQTLSGNGTTNYTVTPTLNSCAGSPITVAVTVNPNPTATATPVSATICSGSATNIALTSTPNGASFAWTAATASGTVNGSSASSGTSIAQTLSGNGTTNYTVTPTLNSCTGSPITVAVTVKPNPVVSAIPASATICSGTATNIALASTPTGAIFAWDAATASGTVTGASAGSGSSITQTLSGTGVAEYTIVAVLSGCVGESISVPITVKKGPSVIATPSSNSICSGATTNVVLTSLPTGASFSWAATTASGTVTGTSDGSGTIIAETLSGSGIVNFAVIATLNSCAGDPTIVPITVKELPTVVVSQNVPIVCSGASTNIDLTSSPAGATFSWTVAIIGGTVTGAFSGSGSLIEQTLTGQAEVKYTITPMLNGCSGIPTDKSVAVLLPPTAIATPVSQTICSGTATNIALTSTPTGASFAWTAVTASGTVTGTSPSAGTSIVQTLTGNGIVNYVITPKSFGCAGDPITVAVTVATSSAPTITTQPIARTICVGSGTTFSVSASNANSYQWEVNDGNGFANVSNGVSYSGATTATLTLTNATVTMDAYTYKVIITSGCLASVTSDVAVLTTKDVIKPIIVGCPIDIALSAASGTCGVIATWTLPTATDNCTSVTLTSDHASGDAFTTGNTVVTYTATDVAGNTSTCSFTVTVTDDENPVFDACLQDVTVTAGAYTYTAPTATDNCSGVIVTKTAGLGSGAIFPEGATVETYEAKDASGNKTTCSFTITATAVSTATQAGKLTNISIYPNPASDVIYISSSLSSNETYAILVQDLTGKTMIQSSFNAADSNFKLELSSLSKGIYFLNIGNGNNRRVEKIIVE